MRLSAHAVAYVGRGAAGTSDQRTQLIYIGDFSFYTNIICLCLNEGLGGKTVYSLLYPMCESGASVFVRHYPEERLCGRLVNTLFIP